MNVQIKAMKQESAALPAVALACAVLFWGSSFAATKSIVGTMSPAAVMWSRLTIGSLAMLPFMRSLWPGRVLLRDWRPLALMALMQPCLYFLLETNALTYTTSSQAGVVSASVPLLVSAGAALFLGEKLSARTTLALAISVGGVVWLTLAGSASEHASNPLLGNLMEFAAMVCAAGYMLVLKRLSDRYNPWTLTALQTFAGALFFLPGAPEALAAVADWSMQQALALLYLGIVVTLGAFGLYNWGMSHMPASKASASINMVPVVAVICGWMFLGETLNPSQMAASGLVLGGVVYGSMKR